MKRPIKILGIGLLCGLMIALVVRRISSESAPVSPAESVPAASEPSPAPSAISTTLDEVLSAEKPEEALARANELEKMESGKRRRDEAAEKTREARVHLQFFKASAWTQVIEANRQKFEALRVEAAHSPHKTVPCSICDAKGVLDLCVVCDHTGKCPTCTGTGKVFNEVCPACVGSGKCFLCFGSGKMPCPFCQSLPLRKEVITPGTPDPRMEIPVE